MEKVFNKFLLRLISLLIVNCSLFTVFAEHEFSLRIAPALVSPVGANQFGPGVGANASIDWAFWNFAGKFNFGLNLSGVFASMNVINPKNKEYLGDPFTLFEGKGGIFVNWRPFDRWTFQTGFNVGVYQHSRGEERDTRGLLGGTLGAQFHLLPYLSLYAQGGYTYRTFAKSGPLHSVDAALGVKLNFSEIMGRRARVKIEKTQQNRVFPVSWAWYENNPVATVKVSNEEPNAITGINLSFFMDSYMSQPWTFAEIPQLAAGESIEVPVTALFNEAMMNLTETVNANGTIQLQYRSLGARKETISSIQMPIFHRNTLSWDDDRRAAAFVSPKDSAARLFARYVASAIEANPLQGNTPYNVQHAIALFEALRLYGITYVVVPATSFANVSADESVLDNVSFPYQALYYRGGDCSYLSILFCSMLEALNIESAFITIPGHIYIAFEVGDDTWQANNRNIIQIDGDDGISRRWLPVEITVPGEGFNRAWTIGALQWNKYGEKAALYPIREAWKIYPPVTVPGSGDHPPIMPEWNEILRAIENQVSSIR